jgi:hypothetical protein
MSRIWVGALVGVASFLAIPAAFAHGQGPSLSFSLGFGPAFGGPVVVAPPAYGYPAPIYAAPPPVYYPLPQAYYPPPSPFYYAPTPVYVPPED